MAKKEEKEQMLTAAKIADELGVPVGKIKKTIQELAIEPDQVKCKCNYYSSATIAKIKKSID